MRFLVLLLLTLSFGCSYNSKNGANGTNSGQGNNGSLQKVESPNSLRSLQQDFFCKFNGQGFNMRMNSDGTLLVKVDSSLVPGSYTIQNDGIKFIVPQLRFQEKSKVHEIYGQVLVTFVGNTMQCSALSNDITEKIDISVQCPSIKYIPNSSMQKNFFHFHNDGHIQRVIHTDIPNDTLYENRYGTYIKKGNSVVMLFGQEDNERVLNGTITNEGLIINELEPERGACTLKTN